MDLRKVKPSKHFEDRTGPQNPMIAWLAEQPSSQTPLTDHEKDLMASGGWTVNDIYFNRYIQGNTEHMMTKGYYKRQSPMDMMFDMFPSPYIANPKKYKDLYGYGEDWIDRGKLKKPKY